jgi:hypothetical protein
MNRAHLLLVFLAACPDPAPPPPPPTSPPPEAAASAPREATPASQASATASDVQAIAGVVSLGAGASQGDVRPEDVLFIMIRQSQGGAPGPLIAVQRHTGVRFPKEYQIGAADVMMPGVPFQGPFVVTARLDRDGDPMTKTPDDLYGQYGGDVMQGTSSVQIELAKAKVVETPPSSPPPEKRPSSRPVDRAPASRPAPPVEQAPASQPRQPSSQP